MAAALIGFTVVLLAAAGCGMTVLRALRAESDSPAERLVMGSAVGLGLLAYAVLAIGLLGWLQPTVLAALVLAEAVIGARALWTFSSEALGARRRALGAPPQRRTRNAQHPAPNTQRLTALLLAAFCLLVVGWTLVGALAPPNGDDWDGVAYHLAAPKIYLAEGRIRFIPYDSHTNFPFTLEMLYVVGLAHGGPAGAKLFHWATGWLTALGIAAFCRRLFPHEGEGVAMPAWGPPLAAALFLGIPQVQWQATVAYIDLGTTLFQFLALVAFIYAVTGRATPSESQVGWLVVCGLMSGWAMGTKMTALLPFGLLGLAAIVWAGLGRPDTERGDRDAETPAVKPKGGSTSDTRQRWVGAAALVIVGVLVACPWYIKSYLWTNNPVYPFFYSLFPSSVGWTAEAEAAYRHEQGFFGLGKGPLDFLMAPWHLAMNGWAYFNVPSRHSPPGTMAYFDGLRRGGISAAFLGLVPLALFTRCWDRRLTGLILYALALLLPWFVLTQQSRYLIPVVAPLAVVAAAVVANLEVDLTRWAAGIFVGVLLLLHAAWGWSEVFNRAFPVVSGQVSREAYLRRTFQAYEASEFINTLPPASKIALFQETRGYYMDRNYLWANPLQNTLIPFQSLRSGAELVQFMKSRLGVTHVLFNRAGAANTEKNRWHELLQDAISRGDLVPLHASRGIEVYAIPDGT